MVTLCLIVGAVLMLVGVLGCGYMMCADKCLFHRLCAYNSFSACLTCFCEIVATLFAAVLSDR